MAGSIYQWSTTAADNGTADADVPWPEGMARRQVNDSARSLMGRVAELLGDIGGALSAGGTANGLTVTANSGFTTYADGRLVSFRATADNTGAATLNVNGIGAKSIRKMINTGDIALSANDICNTGIYVVQYQSALNGAVGAWLLINPTLSSAVYALSSLVTTDNTVPRFDGTAGRLQSSGVTIDDSNNLSAASVTATGAVTAGAGFVDSDVNCVLACTGTTGSIFLRPQGVVSTTNQTVIAASTGNMTVAGAIAAGGDVSGTTGTFSGTMTASTFSGSGASLTFLPAAQLTGTVASDRISGSYTGITGTGALNAGSITSGFSTINIGTSAITAGAASFTSMACSGQVTGTTAIFSSTVTGPVFTAAAATNTIIASPTTNMLFRPTGSGSSTGQMVLAATTGDLTVAGDITVTSGDITVTRVSPNTGNNLVLAGDTTSIVLRPNGSGSTTNQGTYDTSGNFTAAGDLIASDDLLVGVTALINPAAAEYGMSADGGGLMTISRNADVPLRVKRNGDGTLVAWYNGTTNIAVVSQAADLVTYGTFCGAHWSQWAGEPPTEIPRGTILETVDEMCLWEGEANSTLPKVKISGTPGSKRVYGVYSHPDSEDPDRDFHVAALGAHPVRITAGTTVQNGDLLESNGDGTARVQEPEVFTSRTIAKVTSATVVEVYPDGSYLVPCTLHCG